MSSAQKTKRTVMLSRNEVTTLFTVIDLVLAMSKLFPMDATMERWVKDVRDSIDEQVSYTQRFGESYGTHHSTQQSNTERHYGYEGYKEAYQED